MMFSALFKQGIKGNVQAAKEWLDRVQGKVPDKLQHAGTIGISCMEIEHVTAAPRPDVSPVFSPPR